MCLQRVIVTDKSCTRVTILGTLKSHCLFPYELWNNTVDVTYHNSSTKTAHTVKKKERCRSSGIALAFKLDKKTA